jgi:hypothetical protein
MFTALMVGRLDDLERVWVSQKADVYSFGILMVSLFVGELRWPEVELPPDAMDRRKVLRQLAVDGVLPTVPLGFEVRCGCGVLMDWGVGC